MNQTDPLWFLFAAYSAVWILLALFLARLGRKHRALEDELGELRMRMGEMPSRQPPVDSAMRRREPPS